MQPPESPEPLSHEESRLPHSKSLPILLVGASVRAAAESAVRAGIPVIACDLFGDRQTRSVSQAWIPLGELRRQMEKSAAKKCSRIVIAGGLADGYQCLRGIADDFRGADLPLLQRVSEPEFLSDLTHGTSVQYPAVDEKDSPKQRWLSKERSGAGGVGVRWHPQSPRDRSAKTRASNAYLQKFVPGRSYGATFVGSGTHAQLLGVCRSLTKRIGEFPFIYAGSAGLLRDERVCDAVQQLGIRFVQETQFAGPFNIDFIDDGKRIWLLEINPRWSASMEIVESAWMRKLGEACSFFDPYESWMERISKFPGAPSARFYKRVLFADRQMHVDPRQFSHDCEAMYWRDVPNELINVDVGMPVATLIADLDLVSVWECRRMLRRQRLIFGENRRP